MGCGLALLAALLLAPACAHDRFATNTPRSATEQLLVAESTERAVRELVLPGVEGRRVAVEVVALGRGAAFYDNDVEYLRAALAERLRQEGARVVRPEDAERIVAVRVATIGTTAEQSVFGLPSIPLLVAATPEIKIYRSERQHGYTKLRAVQRDTDGHPVAAPETTMGRTRFRIWKLLFLSIRSDSDIYPRGLGP